MNTELTGWLGPGAEYTGDLVFTGRVRIDGRLTGSVRTDDLLEIGRTGRVDGEVDVAQALIAGRVDGLLRVRERCTLLESAVIFGQVVTPWLDVRLGARIRGEVLVEREKAAGGST